MLPIEPIVVLLETKLSKGILDADYLASTNTSQYSTTTQILIVVHSVE
jgi:hypothetical protein